MVNAAFMRLHPVLMEKLNEALEPSPEMRLTRRVTSLPAVPGKVF